MLYMYVIYIDIHKMIFEKEIKTFTPGKSSMLISAPFSIKYSINGIEPFMTASVSTVSHDYENEQNCTIICISLHSYIYGENK
jgi:hypothetical protein